VRGTIIPPGLCSSSNRIIVLLGFFFLGTTVLRLKGKGQVSSSQKSKEIFCPMGIVRASLNQMDD